MPAPWDVPEVYDRLHAPGTATAVSGLLRIWRLLGRPARRGSASRPLFLEPACGTARFLRALAARGHRSIGFDRSETLLEYARSRLASLKNRRLVRLFAADLQRFPPPLRPASIDLGFIPDNTIRLLKSDRALVGHLREMSRVLKPGGLYLVGLSLTRYGREEPEEDVWTAGRGRRRITEVVQYLPPAAGSRRETVVSHIRAETAGGVRLLDSRYSLRCYDARQWRSLLARTPFEVVQVTDASGLPIPEGVYEYEVHVLRLTPAGTPPATPPRAPD